MDENLVRILYNVVCLTLSLIMIKGKTDKAFKVIGVFFALTFMFLLMRQFGVKNGGGFGTIILTIAYLIFLVKIIRTGQFKLLQKLFLILLPSATILKLYNGSLHLHYSGQTKLFSIFTLAMMIGYFFFVTYIKKDFERQREAFEANGLFAAILLSTLVR